MSKVLDKVEMPRRQLGLKLRKKMVPERSIWKSFAYCVKLIIYIGMIATERI